MMGKGVDLGDVCFNIVISALVQVRTISQPTSFKQVPSDDAMYTIRFSYCRFLSLTVGTNSEGHNRPDPLDKWNADGLDK